MPTFNPYLLYANDKGEIFEDTSLLMAGASGNQHIIPDKGSLIQLPEGSDIFHLPGRRPLGWNPQTNRFEVCKKGWAVSAFVAPAYTIFAHAAWKTEKDAPRLPLYAYSAVGWYNNNFYVPAMRIDPDIRQDCHQFDQKVVIKNAKAWLKENPRNRLLKHLSHCALVYFCPAARNYFLNRWEAPLPTSPSCNSRCLGCISYQPKTSEVVSTQNRISFVPAPEEIAEIAVAHLETAPDPVVSFGQGCEGEPLMVWETIRDGIKLIRKKTTKGIINLNSNSSKPEAIEQLCKAGLQSIRVSMNSAQESLYNSYYKPKGYCFSDVLESIEIARKNNIWISLNYFVFPGVTDLEKEKEKLFSIIKKYRVNMIQWRNFNIDPEWYLSEISMPGSVKTIGVKKLIDLVKAEFPWVYNGYFNPGKDIIDRWMKKLP